MKPHAFFAATAVAALAAACSPQGGNEAVDKAQDTVSAPVRRQPSQASPARVAWPTPGTAFRQSPFGLSETKPRRNLMLKWALIFAVIAIVAALLGFGGIAGAAAGIAKILAIVAVVVFLVFLVLGFTAAKKIT